MNIKLSKIQLAKITQFGGFLGRIVGPLLKVYLLLMKYLFKLLAKSALLPLRLTAASALDAGVHKKNCVHEIS